MADSESNDKEQCVICRDEPATVMSDGTNRYYIGDRCRELVTTLFYVHRSLPTAVAEATQAKRGNHG